MFIGTLNFEMSVFVECIHGILTGTQHIETLALLLRRNSDDYRGTLEPFTFPRNFVFSFFGKIIT